MRSVDRKPGSPSRDIPHRVNHAPRLRPDDAVDKDLLSPLQSKDGLDRRPTEESIGRDPEQHLKLFHRFALRPAPQHAAGLASRPHDHLDRLGHNRRVVWHMVFVAQQQLNGVPAWTESEAGLGLTASEMQVVKIIGNWPVQRRQRRVDQKMMVPGVFLLDPRRSDAHIQQAEANDRLRWDGLTVRDVLDVSFGIGR